MKLSHFFSKIGSNSLVLLFALPGLATAAAVDLSDLPIANVVSTQTVRPNITAAVDVDATMGQQFSPNYVGSAGSGTCPTPQALTQPCTIGDPPMMSPDFNQSYYNPEFSYTPPVYYDGGDDSGELTSGTSANTTAWTSVDTDGFDKQKTDQLGAAVASVNLAAAYPERLYCDSTSAAAASPIDPTHCKRNTAGYIYPTGSFTKPTNLTSGLSNVGMPYYFRMFATEYCTSEDLRVCVKVALGAEPPNTHPFPAKVRWCDSSANATSLITPADASCQSKRIESQFTSPRWPTQAAQGVAYATLKIGDSLSSDSVRVAQVSLVDPADNSVINLLAGGVVAASGTNSAATRRDFATALATAISANWTWPGRPYRACTANTTPSCSSALAGSSLASDLNLDGTLVIYLTDAAGVRAADANKAGLRLVVDAPASPIRSASGTLTITHSGSGSDKITSITVGPPRGPFVEILNGDLANFATNSSANRAAAAQAVADRINAYINENPWEYSARTNAACGLQPAAANRVCIDIPPTQGAIANNYQIKVSSSGAVTTVATALTDGVSRFIPVTSTPFIGGVEAQKIVHRTNIVSGQSYPRYPNRADCIESLTGCSYAEEMTNFANWYSYYRTQMQAIKTAMSLAFVKLNDNYNLGLVVGGNTPVIVAQLTEPIKQIWYDSLFNQFPSTNNFFSTRQVLNLASRDAASADVTGAINIVTGRSIRYSCQQNYVVLLSGTFRASGGALTDSRFDATTETDVNINIPNMDGVDTPGLPSNPSFCTRSNGCHDGGLSTGTSLADVALYWYVTPVVGTELLPSNVPTTQRDPNPRLHITTFTVGLGLEGLMSYRPDYETATCGGAPGPNGETSCDFDKIRKGLTGCSWQNPGDKCNWPIAIDRTASTVDDLWHAAVNGHGKYYNTRQADELASGLAEILNGVQVREGAAASAVASNPVLTSGDNDIFITQFTTGSWFGEVSAKKIDMTTGIVGSDVSWQVSNTLDNRVRDESDTRTIYTLNNSGASPALKPFAWSALSSAEQEWFSKKCTGATQLSQCTSALNDVQRGLIENGEVMLNYLRGQQEMQTTLDTLNNPLMRVRDHTLGDVVNAKATYVRDSRRAYLDAGYAAFRVTQASRAASLYVAANDGMLHAFKADAENDAGTELWAYVPRQVMPDLWQLADNAYGLHHRYFVDGSPTIGDVALDGVWKTILVAGLNKGGRGFYALDVTDPNRPQALWEFCAEAERCALQDDNLGYSYADPIITKRPSDGKWVVLVTSGYNNNVVPGNNAATGDGKGYLYVLDANTGRLLEKISTDVGDTTTPSGLSKISAWVENAQTDNTTLRVYGGDYLGNLWRFDLPREVGSTITVKRLARLTDPSNLAQPITSAPELGRCESKDMVYIGSGSYLGDSDVSNAQTQTIYAIKDTGTELGVLRPDSNAAASSGDMLQRTLTPFVGSDGRATGELIISNNSTDLDLATRRGWFMDLDQHREGLDEQTGQTIDLPGERVNMLSLPVQLVRNTLVAVTNQPAAAVNACQIGGVSYQYNISACTGGAVNGVLHGVVGTKLADAIVVGSLIVMLPSGKFKLISTLAGGTQKTTDVPIDSGGARRVSWRELTQ